MRLFSLDHWCWYLVAILQHKQRLAERHICCFHAGHLFDQLLWRDGIRRNRVLGRNPEDLLTYWRVRFDVLYKCRRFVLSSTPSEPEANCRSVNTEYSIGSIRQNNINFSSSHGSLTNLCAAFIDGVRNNPNVAAT